MIEKQLNFFINSMSFPHLPRLLYKLKENEIKTATVLIVLRKTAMYSKAYCRLDIAKVMH